MKKRAVTMNFMRHTIASALTLLSLAALPMAATTPRPQAGGPRNLVVYFEFLDNGNGVEEAVAYLFDRMLGPGDQLIILSPLRSYSFSRDTLAQPRAELIALMQEKLRNDIAKSAQSYKQIIGDLDAAAREIEELAYPSGTVDTNKDLGELFIHYRQALANLNQVPLAQHFIYVTSKNAAATGNLFENSGDIYAAFSKLAQATRGVCRTITEPVAGLEAVFRSWDAAK